MTEPWSRVLSFRVRSRSPDVLKSVSFPYVAGAHVPTSGVGTAGFRTLSELERAAADRLPSGIWDYLQGGAGEERTLRANREAFRRRTLRPKVLAGVSVVDLTTTLLGAPVRAPFFVAPAAYQRDIHAEGECGMATAAADAGVLAIVSTLSSFSLEEIAEASEHGPRWFQLYLQPEFAQSERLVRRAERAGYGAIVLTVDAPLLGTRDRQSREGFALDSPVAIGNGPEFVSPARAPTAEGSRFRLRSDAASDWETLDRLRDATRLPLVVKGILRGEDAQKAVDHGAAGIVVSNHGGRQLDGAPATLDVLPEIVNAVGSKTEVYLDGGVRRASDVVMALALGAHAVGIGRPILWALAAGGRAGVARYFELLSIELANTMTLMGSPSLSDLDPDMVAVGP